MNYFPRTMPPKCLCLSKISVWPSTLQKCSPGGWKQLKTCHVNHNSVKKPAFQCLLGCSWMRFLVLKRNCYSFQTVIIWLISPFLLSFLVTIQLVMRNISSHLELRNLKWNNFSMHLSLIKLFAHRISHHTPPNISRVEMWVFSTHDIPKHCIITRHLSTLSSWV